MKQLKQPRQLIIKGKTEYVKKMFAHLKKEHPSTKKRMVLK